MPAMIKKIKTFLENMEAFNCGRPLKDEEWAVIENIENGVYKEEDGQTKFYRKALIDVIAEDGNVLTYNCKVPFRENGIFRYAYRAFPWNEKLPHRQDFAYLKWF